MVMACLALLASTPTLSGAQADSSTVQVPPGPPVDRPFSWWIPQSWAYDAVFMHAEGDTVIVITAPGMFEARCQEYGGDLSGLARFRPDRLAALLEFQEQSRYDRRHRRSRKARTPRVASVRSADGDSTRFLLQATRVDPKRLRVRWASVAKGTVPDEESWMCAGDWHTVKPTTRDDIPELGEYVLVDRRPEPIIRVPPTYPDQARERGVHGEVLVHALVGWDGLVKEARPAVSIPLLDSAASAAVQRWRFKPALVNGSPVPVWVPIPVRFSLH